MSGTRYSFGGRRREILPVVDARGASPSGEISLHLAAAGALEVQRGRMGGLAAVPGSRCGSDQLAVGRSRPKWSTSRGVPGRTSQACPR
jgi:hypothetical protein